MATKKSKNTAAPIATNINKPLMVEKREFHNTKFLQDHNAITYINGLAEDVDLFIQTLMDNQLPKGISIIACGGYGRKELFPFSDIDLLILYDPIHKDSTVKPLVEQLLYSLWNCDFKTGHAVRTIEESIQTCITDTTARTNMLDARLVVGDQELFNNHQLRFHAEAVEPDQLGFVEAKLAERDTRHKKFGDSRYMLEPNIKEGKGGLRDLQTLYWIAKHVYNITDVKELVEKELLTQEEYHTYKEAHDFLCCLRVHLHLATGKAEDRLTFDMQRTLAHILKYRAADSNKAVEKLMKRYFMTASAVGSLTRIVCALLEEENKRKPILSLGWILQYPMRLSGFSLDAQRLNVWSEDEFEQDPVRMLELFHVAQEHQVDIHPKALQLVTRNLHLIDKEILKNRRANELFLSILLSRQGPEQTLRKMNEVGLLGKFIPDFGKVHGQMQFNMYHTYTVDEHTIVALGILRNIEKNKLRSELPLASDLIHRIHSRRALYLALFCHDIAKGRETDHSEAGEEIATKLAIRLGFTKEEVRTTGWLVKNHLILSHTAFKRDLNDPKTIQDIVSTVQTVERLRLLLVLTVADIRAVGPAVWNAWKGTLLRELYTRAEKLIRTGQIEQEDDYTRRLKQNLHALMPYASRPLVEEYLNLSPSSLLGSFNPQTHVRLIEMLEEIKDGAPISIKATHDTAHSISEIIICSFDQPFLFSKLAGAFSVAGANIQSAQGYTLENGIAVDIFHIQDMEGHAFDRPDKMARLTVKLEQTIEGTLPLQKELANLKPTYPSRKDALKVPGAVFFENDASNVYTVIEVSGLDRAGLLHDITNALSQLKLSIASAHISTYGEQAVDVFYVKDAFGMKILHEKRIQEITDKLLKALQHV